jgi:serine/threonine protein kinase
MIHSSVFTHERTPRGRVYRRRATPLEHVFSIIDRHRQIMSGREFGEVVKRHPKTYITRLRFPEADGETFYVKEFIRSGARRLLPRRRRHAPALTSWRAALAMTVRGIPAPEAVAVLLGNRASSYLIMRAVGDAEPLVDAIHRAVGPSVPLRRRRDFLRAAADFLMKCYAAGVFHCDLKSGNVLLRELPSGGWEFVLLDLAAVKFPRRISLDSKILNLAQLNASIPTTLTWTDRLRFLRHMAEHEPLLGERSSMLDIARITRRRNCPWAPR